MNSAAWQHGKISGKHLVREAFIKHGRLLVATFAVAISTLSWAQPPVPFYAANVTQIDKQGPGAVVIVTKDSAEAVCAWYRKNLDNANGEHKTDDGAVIFYTKSGATVDV